MSHPIGIDLGTTFSAIAKWEVRPSNTGPNVYNNPTENTSGGSLTLASKVYFPDINSKDRPVVGTPALQQGVIRPNLYFSAFKREMDSNAIIEREGGFQITPVELSALVVEKLLSTAEKEEGPGTWVPDGVVVSVPAYFNQNQNRHTVDAIKMALRHQFEGRKGFNEDIFIRLIPEPVAAGLDYVFDHPNEIKGHKKIVIFDLGGGTFDITIFEVDNDLKNKKITFTTLATDGNARLGGEDFDRTLKKYIIEDEGYKEDEMSSEGKALLIQRCTGLKCDLTSLEQAEISVPYIIGTQHLNRVVERRKFDDCMSGRLGEKIDYIADINDCMDHAFQMSGLHVNDIDYCILIGGSSKIPCIRSILEQRFSTNKVVVGNIGLGVVRGASLIAAFELDRKLKEQGKSAKYMNKWDEIVIKENTAHNLGIKSNKGYTTIIRQNAATPARGIRTFTPMSLNEDGTKALLPLIEVYQGGGNKWAHVGDVEIPVIYTHGRKPNEIMIQVEFIAESTQVHTKIIVEQGNQDKTDLIVTKPLDLSGR